MVVPPLLIVHEGSAAEEVDVAQCTQPSFTTPVSGLKRLRKVQQREAFAEVGETTPKPRSSLRSKKVSTPECGLADLLPNLQTPMPESDVPNDFGPPPPDSTPARQRGESLTYNLRNELLKIFNMSTAYIHRL